MVTLFTLMSISQEWERTALLQFDIAARKFERISVSLYFRKNLDLLTLQEKPTVRLFLEG
jgi:hypothetical protein